jgi:hypothetical protein
VPCRARSRCRGAAGGPRSQEGDRELIEKAYDAAKPILDRRRAALRAELDELGSPSGGGSSLRELDPDWDDATPEERRDRRGPRHDGDRAGCPSHSSGCGMAINADKVERKVREHALAKLADPDTRAAIGARDLHALSRLAPRVRPTTQRPVSLASPA